MARASAPLRFKVRAGMFGQLEACERAGLPALRAFAQLSLPGRAQARATATLQLIRRGIAPAQAGEQSGLFTALESRVLGAAFAAGSPATAYARLAAHCSVRARQFATLQARSLIPGVLLLALLLIQPLPLLVAGTLAPGDYVLQVLRTLLAVGGLVALTVYLPARLHSGEVTTTRLAIDAALLRLPLLGRWIERRNLRDFLASLALLLEAGVPMFDAVPVAQETMPNAALRRELDALPRALQRGRSFVQALSGLPRLASSRAVDLARAGEAGGRLPEMLQHCVALESEDIARTEQALADWIPRLLYAAIAAAVAWSLVSGPGVAPRLPTELQ